MVITVILKDGHVDRYESGQFTSITEKYYVVYYGSGATAGATSYKLTDIKRVTCVGVDL